MQPLSGKKTIFVPQADYSCTKPDTTHGDTHAISDRLGLLGPFLLGADRRKLHFTPELLQQVKDMGVDIAEVTLHVGLGTFRPVKETDVLKHHMHSEFYKIEQSEADKINKAKKEGHRVIAVGTTSTRTLESAADENGFLTEKSGWTEIFIYPGYQFKVIDALITNFHLPESTLVMLVSALAGREHVLAAYETAVEEKYRFFSFGDAMFIVDRES